VTQTRAKIPLAIAADDGNVVTLAARLDGDERGDAAAPLALRYRTRTGALLRIGGAVRGAFDREHETIALAPAPAPDATIELEVERRSLPGNGLPPGNGIRWKWLVARSVEEPARLSARVRGARPRRPRLHRPLAPRRRMALDVRSRGA
jgi:hypothetical protein